MGTKLIEVALPLDAINAAAAREKSIRHGHPSTLHLWWARRPLAAARAVLFASLVDDPSSPDYRWPDGSDRARSQDEIEAERKRLHDLIEQLVQWENSNNDEVIGRARAEIMRATDGNPPPVLDPFAGGGSIPLEAQRLGLEAHASDLNPVAVLINKALIEIPPKYAGQPPVNPVDRARGMGAQWKGAAGLAADVRYYGQWMRDEAERRIGHLYPKAQLPDGNEATVIAWLWARTVKSSNPAYADVDVPLVSSFMLSTKAGKEAYVEPVIEAGGYQFEVRSGKPSNPVAAKSGTKLARGANFRCIMSDSPMSDDYIRGEFKAKRNSQRLMAIVAEGKQGRIYLAPSPEHEEIAASAHPTWWPEQEMNQKTSNLVSGRGYGVTHWHEIFTPRQLVALTTFSDLVGEAREKVHADAIAAGWTDDVAGNGTNARYVATASE